MSTASRAAASKVDDEGRNAARAAFTDEVIAGRGQEVTRGGEVIAGIPFFTFLPGTRFCIAKGFTFLLGDRFPPGYEAGCDSGRLPGNARPPTKPLQSLEAAQKLDTSNTRQPQRLSQSRDAFL